MTPVKAIGAQITSYKVNCSIYKPTRSRLVGENLKESIETNTENLYSRFGEDIKNEDITASFENGVLSIKVPKKQEEPKPETGYSIAIN